MRRMVTISLMTALLPALALAQAGSQNIATTTTTYDVKTLSFDRWCQEDEHYPVSRCDARNPADLQAFDDYRAGVERYELQYQKDRETENRFEKDLRRDPSQQQAPAGDLVAPSPQ